MSNEYRQRRDRRPALSRTRRLIPAAGSFLPAETRMHARASAREGFAALRSLADGASDLTERAIDRLTLLFSKR